MSSDRTLLRQSLRDAALLVLVLLLITSVRIGRPKPSPELDLGSTLAADPAGQARPVETLESSEPAEHDLAVPQNVSLPTTPESTEPECGNQGPKDRLSLKTVARRAGYQEPRG